MTTNAGLVRAEGFSQSWNWEVLSKLGRSPWSDLSICGTAIWQYRRHPLPAPCSVTSRCWYLDISHGGSIYTMEIRNCYRSVLNLLYCWLSIFMEVIERMLIMQLRLQSILSVAIIFWIDHKAEGIFSSIWEQLPNSAKSLTYLTGDEHSGMCLLLHFSLSPSQRNTSRHLQHPHSGEHKHRLTVDPRVGHFQRKHHESQGLYEIISEDNCIFYYL